MEPITRRSVCKAAVGAFAGVGAAALSGCSLSLGSRPSNTPADTINVVVLSDANTDASLQKVFRTYEKANPGHKINSVPIPLTTWSDFLSILQTRLAGGADYDAVYLPTEGELTLSTRGILVPLDRYIKTTDAAFMKDYYADVPPAMLKEFRAKEDVGGHTYFVPHLVNTMGIWYNKATFKKAGVAAPAADWTWDDFARTAKALTDTSAKRFGFNIAPDLFQGMDPWLSTNGASVLNPAWTKSTINTPDAVDAVAFARKLVTDGVVPKPGGSFDQYASLANGKLGMLGAGMWGVASFSGMGGIKDLAIAPWPKNTRNGSPMGLGAFGMLKSSKKHDRVWSLIRYLASKEGQDQILTLGAQPVRRSTAASKAYLSNVPEGGQYLTQALDYAHMIVGVEKGGEIGTALQDSWKQMLLGIQTPKAGLADLSQQIDDILKEE